MVHMPTMPDKDADRAPPRARVQDPAAASMDVGAVNPPYNITVRWYPDVDVPEVFHDGLSVGTAAYVLHTAADHIEWNGVTEDEEEE